MKILYIFDEDDKYGAPKSGFAMIMELKKMGIVPIVITSKENNINKLCRENNIENYVTHHHKFTYVNTNNYFKDAIKFIPRFIRYVFGNIIGMYILEKNLDLNTIDMIHCNISAVDLGIKISKKYKIKNIMHVREFGELDFNMKSYKSNYVQYLNNNVTKFIAISNAIKEYWISKGINSEKIECIYNGISDADIQTKTNYDEVNKKLKLLMIGSVSEKKGQTELVKAIGCIHNGIKNNLEVDIIGSGYKFAEDDLRKEIANNHLESIVNFKGFDNDIREKMKEYDLGINCSFSEGFGRVTIEYMLAGLCVVASNTGANVELVEDNVSGVLYNKGEYKDLANKIEYLYSNREKIKEIALYSKKYAKDNYSVQKNAEEVKKLYDKM